MKVARVNGRSVAISDSPYGLGGGTSVPTLSELPDVDPTGLADGDVLVWDDATDTWIPGTGSAGLTISDEGTPLTTAATSIDFVGAGVVATAVGDDVTVTIDGAATGRWELAVLTGSPPDPLYADGDFLYIFVP